MKPDGSGMEMFAEGVRNSVGFDWHPVTGEFWFTDNGRDGIGDDVPDDEFNVAPKAGLGHFGFPFLPSGPTRSSAPPLSHPPPPPPVASRSWRQDRPVEVGVRTADDLS